MSFLEQHHVLLDFCHKQEYHPIYLTLLMSWTTFLIVSWKISLAEEMPKFKRLYLKISKCVLNQVIYLELS